MARFLEASRWLRRAGAVLLCALLFFLWMEESRRLEDPLFMIKIERNVWRRMVLAKHIFGYDLENYCERRFLRFNLSPQVWRANPIQCNPIFSQRLSGLDFSVESQWEKPGRFCYSHATAPAGCLDGCINSIDDRYSALIRNAEGNILGCNAKLERRYGDTRASSYDKAIFRDFDGVASGIGRFVGNENGKEQGGGLKNANEDQETVEDQGPPIFRRLILAIFLELTGYSVGVWGVLHFNDKRRGWRATFMIGGWLIVCSGLLLIWASNFSSTWNWWL